MDVIQNIQNVLNFSGCSNPQFKGNGIGKIGTTGFLLGFFGGIHFCLMIVTTGMLLGGFYFPLIRALCFWSYYFCFLCFFHFFEFFVTATRQPTVVSFDSFVVNHSKNYTIAALCSWIEFWLEIVIFGENQKLYWTVFVFGVILVIGGQIVRTLGMWTCGENFSHQIMERKTSSHQLVTSGIYSKLRHPSYFGWFYWSVGTQIMLCNPICMLFYTWSSWSFFAARIPYEEGLLVDFYGAEYTDYSRSTIIGIPFVESFQPAKSQ